MSTRTIALSCALFVVPSGEPLGSHIVAIPSNENGGIATQVAAAPAVPPPAAPSTASAEDSDVTRVVASVKKAIGDYAAVEKAGPYRFRFAVSAGGKLASTRSVVWDPARGLARVDLTTKIGAVACAFEPNGVRNTSKSGERTLEGKDAEGVHSQVRKAFRGDWNYLTLAHRLSDPTLVVELEGEVVEDGATLDRLKITYTDSVQGFQGDTYGLLVDRKTGLPTALFVKWRSMKADQEPLRFDYVTWTEIGAIRLPAKLTGVGNPQELAFEAFESGITLAADEFLGVEE